jgi:hypothetical protein
MDLKPTFVFRPQPALETLVHQPFPNLPDPLGPLSLLPGKWTGTGFNMIWRPLFGTPGQDHFLELNLISETLEFAPIPGPIPNRGLLQPDINMFGVHYLQQISDSNTGAGLHMEPGIWATVPQTTNPDEPPTVVRMGTIPHGTSILIQGTAIPSAGGPTPFPPISTIPFDIGDRNSPRPMPEAQLSVPSPFRSPPAQMAGITQAMLDDPNTVLGAAAAGQTILATTTMLVFSEDDAQSQGGIDVGGGTANTAFLVGSAGGPNAVAAEASAAFWIEQVAGENGEPDFLQLQYSQQVLLNFNGLSWPHITVATLRKQVPVQVPPQYVDPDIPAENLQRIAAARAESGVS